MATAIRETVAALTAPTPGKIKVGLITPGIGSSGYYSAEVLKNAADEKIWPKGTHVYFDHPSESEMHDRPERSVRDLAAVFAEDAYWDGDGLVAEADVIGPYRDLVTDKVFAENVGMSIRAYAETRPGEAEGKKVQIITRLEEGLSVDLVTHAGRGGRVLAVLESVRATAAREATANDTRTALHDALKAAYGGEDVWVWARDFDETTVWFDFETPEAQTVYQQGYTLSDDGAVTLADGDPVEVRARTQYVPVTRDGTEAEAAAAAPTNVPAPAGQSTATESEETNMATTQIEEAELGRLRQDAERVHTLESERDTAQRERDEAREALASRDRDALIVQTISEADTDHALSALERRGLAADATITDDGQVDVDALREATTNAIATKAEEAGAGTVRGFGSTSGGGTITEAEFDRAMPGEQVKEA